MTFMRIKIFDRVAVKLVLWSVLISFILTLLGTSLQLYFDYKNRVDQLLTAADNIVSKHLPELSKSLALEGRDVAPETLNHLLDGEAISYVAILVDSVAVLELGMKIAGESKVRRYVLRSNEASSQFSGILEVSINLQPIRSELLQRFGKTLISNGIGIFVTAAFIFFLFQLLITNHLEKLVEQVRNFDPAKPHSPLKRIRDKSVKNDELQQVVDGVNTMLQKAQSAYEALAKNEERLLLFFDATEEAIVGIDRTGLCSFANDASLTLFKIKDYESIIGKNIGKLFTHFSDAGSSDKARESSIISKSMEQARMLQCEDGLILLPDDREIHVSLRSYPVFQEGIVAGALIFLSDTSQKRKLRRRSELLNEAVKQIPVMIAITDTHNKIQYVNSGAENLLGFSLDGMVGESLYKFYDEFGGDAGPEFSDIEKRLKEGKPWKGIVEIQSSQKNGLKLYTMFFPVYDESGNHVNTISVSREVTYEIRLHNELLNAKKMEAVGRLSANLAHEFGNPLLGVSAVLRDVKEREVLSKDDSELLSLAYVECERMRDILREFQQLQKEPFSGMELQSIADVLTRVIKDVEPLMRTNNVESSLKIIDDASEIGVNRLELEMVISNVILNAIESMEKNGGHLDISTEISDRFFTISIKDSGDGIKKENQEYIFEPFFSTKPEVEGAGLGLSVAYGAMKSLGGSITFSSEEGKGALFQIQIPIK